LVPVLKGPFDVGQECFLYVEKSLASVAAGEATTLYDYLYVEIFKVRGGREGYGFIPQLREGKPQ